MPSKPTRLTAVKPALRSSTQTFLVGAIAEVIAMVAVVIAVFVGVGSPSTTIAIFLIFSVLGIIASTLAMILAIVGLIRYRSMWGWNLLLLICSTIFNPVLWGLLLLLV